MNDISTISVRHFIKENEKAVNRPLLGETKLYSVTVQVTFRRKNTQFASASRNVYSSLERAFELDGSIFKREADIIKQIVRYEVRSYGKKYSLAGLKNRYRSYSIELSFYIDRYFKNILVKALEKSSSKYAVILNPYQEKEVSVRIYYEAFLKLIDDSSDVIPTAFHEELEVAEKLLSWIDKNNIDATTIDWIDGTLRTKYRSHLDGGELTQNQVTKRLDLLDRIIMVEYTKD